MPFDTNQSPYLDLRDIVAESTRPLLAWVGSGVSAEAGLPTWPALRAELIEGLRQKADSFSSAEKQQLRAMADRAASEPSPWVAFEILRNSLGKTTFRDLVRKPFADAYRAATPDAYGHLWRLGIKGMLTLNLDRFAARSMGETYDGQSHIELSGAAVDRLRTNLSGPRPIVANLHGIIEDTDTWVFTHRQLASLVKRPGYVSFVDTCLSMFTVLFVGISVDDIAVGGHLERLREVNIELPTHFWITDRREFNVDRWAEGVGIRVIRYAAPDSNYSELSQLFDDLRTFVPTDRVKPPPVSLLRANTSLATAADPDSLPGEEELLAWPAEEIRRTLNAHAQHLLATVSEEAYEAYERFAEEYDQAIYRAWYTSATPGKNTLLGYELEERAGRGAFGIVYRAKSPDGHVVAIKVLLDEVRQDAEALRSFRRGVRSMKILEEHELAGMVNYLEASEIPAFVVMDWIEGPNLAEAKQAKLLEDWSIVLDIAAKLTGIIRTAHMLPERVLHRDIRPANVMLRDYWSAPETLDVVVLDFDLSWHVGASEKSVLHTTSVGFLAPEQLQPMSSASTRSALVDSFGLGMTFLFLCNGQEPIADQHRHVDWRSDVGKACADLPRTGWVSLPDRFGRLIVAATCDTQSERWGLAEIERELTLLQGALRRDGAIHPELLAEELAARTEVMRGYDWSDDVPGAKRGAGTGVSIEIAADLANDELTATIEYVAHGSEDRAKLSRIIRETARAVRDQFAAGGWTVGQHDAGYAHMMVTARTASEHVAKDLDGAAATLDRIVGRLSFDRI